MLRPGEDLSAPLADLFKRPFGVIMKGKKTLVFGNIFPSAIAMGDQGPQHLGTH